MARRKPAETPLMRQFLSLKEQHPEGILFFRCGDFYEMFFEDAVRAAEALDLTLTSRDKGKKDAVPMAGVPHHAARGYIAKLTELGHKVVLAEQVEDPKLAKGLVKREIVRVITPGIVVDDEVLEPKTARYVASVVAGNPGFGVAFLDVSTGEFRATHCDDEQSLASEIARGHPREVVASAAELAEGGPLYFLKKNFKDAAFSIVDASVAAAPASVLDEALATSIDDLGLVEQPDVAAAAARAVEYARATQPAGRLPLTRLWVYRQSDAIVLDEAAVANLELVRTLGGDKRGSLLSIIDRTRTAPGGRLLRSWLLYPLTELAPIRRRQDAVEALFSDPSVRLDLREALRRVYDMERIAGRVSLGVATPRDLGQLRASLAALPEVARLASSAGSPGVPADLELLRIDPAALESLAELHSLLDVALVAEPPAKTSDGGIIRAGYCEVVDEQRGLASGGKEAVLAIERRERERTDISTLKVKYNRVFGYYIEVTKSNLARVPDDYVRKQTVATAERYVTSELATLEAKIISAQDAVLSREAELFAELVAKVAAQTESIIAVARRLAAIDCCAALAEVAHENGYVRPQVDESDVLDIADGRHPVVEQAVPAGTFVPNDCWLDSAKRQVVVITGPNMAGKSTYMRQVAQIVLLAQMGGFVPASRARIGLVDRVFTRVGAADNLSRGESTFMVEMRETASILAGASKRSLVVLDEVGRGTSTYDGVSIAWAVTEYLHDAIGCRTLFATHYHELCALAENRERIHNCSVSVKAKGGSIVFLRQVVDGGSNRSHGIDVARLAGLPRAVISRARRILGRLEEDGRIDHGNQLALFAGGASDAEGAGASADERAILDELAAADVSNMTPLDALNLLNELRERLAHFA